MRVGKNILLKATKSLTNVANAYLESPDDFVRTFTVRINGKKRSIITYKPDSKGAALRHVHSQFAYLMEGCYKSMPNSYAYKKGKGILPFLENHLQSNVFFKTDIHDYFNSIQFDHLLKIILEDKACKTRPKRIELLLKSCFYDGHMPIGFVSSPVLSDMYLHKVDELFLNKDSIIYTRYADDFVISGKDNMPQLEQAKTELEDNLSEYGLVLNTKKTYFRTLRQPGDAIHLLGVNLVNNDPEPNRITVSDRYIRETSMDICKFFTEYQDMDQDEKRTMLESMLGKIEFIHYMSESSYKKLEKMVNVKSGKQLEFLKVFVNSN